MSERRSDRGRARCEKADEVVSRVRSAEECAEGEVQEEVRWCMESVVCISVAASSFPNTKSDRETCEEQL